jgi:SAM-dependent methyltransferase
MGFIDEYRRQYAFRPWDEILAALPPLRGKTVLDLGCGPGDQAAALAARGARVIGLDLNAEVVAYAAARGIPGATFRVADLKLPLEVDGPVDGLWSGFSAAYFTDLAPTLRRWSEVLRPGGFAAVVEIDDFFGHEPLPAAVRARFDAYADDGLAAGRYDFRMGRKLRASLEAAGLRVEREFRPRDRELAFDGPADPDALAAWRARFEWMGHFRQVCGADFEATRDAFLACLASPDHVSRAQVVVAVATKPE